MPSLWCERHNQFNCVVCALDKQTAALILALGPQRQAEYEQLKTENRLLHDRVRELESKKHVKHT